MRRTSTRRTSRVVAPLVVLGLIAAACGDDDDEGGDATATATDEAAATTAARRDPRNRRPPRRRRPPPPPRSRRQRPSTTAAAPAEIATDIGVDDTTIKVGMLADLSGAFAPLVTEIVEAQKVYWDTVNANGGIAGRQIELVIEDNGYDVAAPPGEVRGAPQRGRDLQPVDRVAAHRVDLRQPDRGRPRRDPAVVVLGLGVRRARPERVRDLHELLRRIDERPRVAEQEPRGPDRRDHLVPRRVRR